MKINNKYKNENINNNKPFGSMSLLSKGLYTLSNNDMLNAAAVDFFATDNQRTIVEYKNRGKQAAIEMGFREYTGTMIVEFSAVLFAFLTSHIISKFYKPDIKVNPSSWATNKSLDTFNEIYKNSDKTPQGFIKDSLNSMSGIAGKDIKKFSQINTEKAKPVIESLSSVITNKNLSKKEIKKASQNIQTNIINILGADNNIAIKSENNEFRSNLTHTVRDIIDLGRNVFFSNNTTSKDKIIEKLKKINKAGVTIAIPASMILAISNQYINRKLTKKRTGIDNFVGENGYEKNVKDKNEQKKEKGLLAKKLISSGVFIFMLSKVMGIKNPAQLAKKLEFDGPATGGDAIKTIYGTLILGRIMASKSSTELRETNTRDYLGFLNWLVFGSFVAKGAAQVMDPKKEFLFNISKEGKGIKHWLNDISLKSQKEIIAQGGNTVKNLRKLNIAQLSGIAYSALMLGVLLPKLNIFITKNKKEKNSEKNINNFFLENLSIEKFEQNLSKQISR